MLLESFAGMPKEGKGFVRIHELLTNDFITPGATPIYTGLVLAARILIRTCSGEVIVGVVMSRY